MLFLTLALIWATACPCAPAEAPPHPAHAAHRLHLKKPHARPTRADAAQRQARVATQSAEVVLRRRVARLLRLAMLERREADLRDFVVAAHTETLALRDAAVHRLDIGLAVGPAIVTKDFLGGHVVRVRVKNLRHEKLSVVLELHVRSHAGQDSTAVAVAQLGADEESTMELLCPHALDAAQLEWKATAL